MTIKIKGVFKGLSNPQDLSMQVEYSNQKSSFEGTIKTFKKNKFQFPLDREAFFNGKKSAKLTINLVDQNGDSANFNKKGNPHELDPDQQSFSFTLKNKKKGKLKLSPETSPLSDDTAPPTTDGPTWSLGSLNNLGAKGVSAHLETQGNGYRLSYAGDGALNVSDMDSSFKLTPRGTIQRISDLTVVDAIAGQRRGYYVELNPDTMQKEIYAADISDDGLILSNSVGTGFTNEGSMAWGVPDAVRIPDGRIRLYWVQEPPAGGQAHEEWTVSATSTDSSGTTFIKDPGQRTTGGYVDFEVLQAKTNDWIAVMSSTPHTIPDQPQGIYVGTSKDGLSWSVDPQNLAPTSMSYLDPTGVPIGDNQWQLVLSESASVLGERDYNLVRTTLSLA